MLAEMTWPEVDEAIGRGAGVFCLWGSRSNTATTSRSRRTSYIPRSWPWR
jgi:hypothetical protein